MESYSKSIKESSPTGRRLPMPTNKDSSNVYFPNKLFNLKKSQKKTLKPLYLSVAKKKIEQDEKEKEREKEREKSLNSSTINKNNSISNAKKPKTNNSIFQTQNYNTLNKSVLNSALNKSNFNDDKSVNNISKLDNSIVEMSETNKNEIGGENNNDLAKDGVENDQINENLEGNPMGENSQEKMNNDEAEIMDGVENANRQVVDEQKNDTNNNENVEAGENKEEIVA